jgi:hypothetical protein
VTRSCRPVRLSTNFRLNEAFLAPARNSGPWPRRISIVPRLCLARRDNAPNTEVCDHRHLVLIWCTKELALDEWLCSLLVAGATVRRGISWNFWSRQSPWTSERICVEIVPQTGALTRLRYAPYLHCKGLGNSPLWGTSFGTLGRRLRRHSIHRPGPLRKPTRSARYRGDSSPEEASASGIGIMTATILA